MFVGWISYIGFIGSIGSIGLIGPGEMGNALHYREFHWINLIGSIG
jgi:hypothetical protein